MGKDLYKQAGVDIEQGDALVDWLKSSGETSSTKVGSAIEGIGGFAGLFAPNFSGMEKPVLVAGTDGVGTKLLLAIEEERLEGVGIDLVAMCVNDLYCVGARPMFFIDYFATGKLSDEQFKTVLTGIRQGVKESQCCLLGGETAELPGLYADKHFDLAGFVVGVVDHEKRLGPHLVQEGDRLVALQSSGFHSNGYSLLRRWLKEKPQSEEIVKKILEPTKIYGSLPDLLDTLPSDCVHALANITGGGLSGNLIRVLPEHLQATIEKDALPTPAWMSAFIKDQGCKPTDVEDVLNLGVGMIACVNPSMVETFKASIQDQLGVAATEIGSIKRGDHKVIFA